MDSFSLATDYEGAASAKHGGKIVTVGALLVNENGNLLALNSAEDKFAGMTGIPRGKLQAGENKRTALEREVYEETGMKIYSRQPLLKTETDTHVHFDHIAQVRGSKVTLSKEHSGYVWLPSLDAWPDPKEPLVDQLIQNKRGEIEAFVRKTVRLFRLQNDHRF